MTIGRSDGNFCHVLLRINMTVITMDEAELKNRNINIAYAAILIKKNMALSISNMSVFDFVLKISGSLSQIKLRFRSVKSVVYLNLIQQVTNAKNHITEFGRN